MAPKIAVPFTVSLMRLCQCLSLCSCHCISDHLRTDACTTVACAYSRVQPMLQAKLKQKQLNAAQNPAQNPAASEVSTRLDLPRWRTST